MPPSTTKKARFEQECVSVFAYEKQTNANLWISICIGARNHFSKKTRTKDIQGGHVTIVKIQNPNLKIWYTRNVQQKRV